MKSHGCLISVFVRGNLDIQRVSRDPRSQRKDRVNMGRRWPSASWRGFDLLAVQGTLSLKASILRYLAFIMVQLSHLYMTTGKTIALTIGTFVDKMISLLFNMLSMFVITFLPRSKHLLILWVQSLCALISEPKKIKSCHFFHFFSICHEVMGLDAMILVF